VSLDERADLPPRLRQFLNPMSTDRYLQILGELGLELSLENGEPVVRCGCCSRGVTAKAAALLKFHRERLIHLLSRPEPQP
jgi:hypothetical protein